MKKIDWIVIGISVIALASVAIVMLNVKDKQKVDIPDVPKVEIKESIPYNKEFILKNVVDNVGMLSKTYLSENEIESIIKFGEYKRLEKIAISNITADSIEEIWFVKLELLSQEEDVVDLLLDRYTKLKQKYYGNEKINLILNNEDNVAVSTMDGIVMMVISENANKVIDEIEKEFDRVREEKIQKNAPLEGEELILEEDIYIEEIENM